MEPFGSQRIRPRPGRAEAVSVPETLTQCARLVEPPMGWGANFRFARDTTATRIVPRNLG
jgi:hypothetical protein